MFTKHPTACELLAEHPEVTSDAGLLGLLTAAHDSLQRDHARLLDAVKGHEWLIDPTPGTADVEDQAADAATVARVDGGHEYIRSPEAGRLAQQSRDFRRSVERAFRK